MQLTENELRDPELVNKFLIDSIKGVGGNEPLTNAEVLQAIKQILAANQTIAREKFLALPEYIVLRDQFACAALGGLLASNQIMPNDQALAYRAWIIADAMLAGRGL